MDKSDESVEVDLAPYPYAYRFLRAFFDRQHLFCVQIEITSCKRLVKIDNVWI